VITVLALSPSLDITYLVDRLTLGGIGRPTEVLKLPGGKGLNVARAAVALGAEVSVIAPFAGHIGSLVSGRLAESGVAVTSVAAEGETRSCVSIASRSDSTLTEVYEPPTPIGPAWAQLEGAVAEQRSSWLVLSGSVPPDVDLDALARSLVAARRAGARIAVDTHGAALDALVESVGPDLVKVNRAEAAAHLGVAADTELALLAQGIRRGSGGDVVITDGAAGSLAVTRDGDAWTAGRGSTFGAYPVGSGDCFLAALLVALDGGETVDRALTLAAACAGANAATPGAALFDVDLARSDRESVSVRPRAMG
jgi:1-phosphofructokinase family hexose kinase